jgi:hypothetical protein
LIYGDLGILVSNAAGELGPFSIQFYPDFDLRYYTFVGVLGQPTVFWRRSVMEKIGQFDIRYRLLGDCEFWLRAALGGVKLRHIPELMAVQVEHGSTLRATQATRMNEEFDALRRAMMPYVDPPSSPRWERLKKSVAWRARQLEFFCAMKAGYPHKWLNFVKELHAQGVDVSARDLRLLAPARWRGGASLLGDASAYGILGSERE